MNKIQKELLGKEVDYIYHSWMDLEDDLKRVVAGIDPILGITLVAPSSKAMCCITPYYFRGFYTGAYFETVFMLQRGYFDTEKLDPYKIYGTAENQYKRDGVMPICPFR